MRNKWIALFAALILTGCTVAPATVTEPPTTETVSTAETTVTTTVSTTVATKPTTTKKTTKKTAATTSAPTEPDEREGYSILNIIPDSDFLNGMIIKSQKDHAHGDKVTNLGQFFYTDSDEDPTWEVCQWDSGPCIWKNRVFDDPHVLTDGVSKWVTCDVKNRILGLRINTDAYYQGRGAVQGDYWPHLLMQQGINGFTTGITDERKFYTGAAEKMILSMDLRLSDYVETYNEDDWVEAAQLYMYFYLRLRDNSHFVWFGIQLFDSRYEFSNDTLTIDIGKADASNLPIYLIGMWNAYQYDDTFWKDGKPVSGKDWRHIEVDLVPHFEKLCKRCIANGYYPVGTTPADIHISGMNYGWEVIGTYDIGMDIQNLKLESWFPDNEV